MWTKTRGAMAVGAAIVSLPLLAAAAAAQTTPVNAPATQPAAGPDTGLGGGLGGGAGLPGGLPDPAALSGGTLDPEIQSLIDEAESTRPVPAQLLNDLAMGTGDANQLINEFLAGGNATPREVAVRAVALSLAVGRDPRMKDSDRRFALNQSINDGMSMSLGAPRILNVKVEADFVPPEGTFAWDLGGLTTPVADGFQQLTPYSTEVGGLGMRDLDRVGDGDVLQDVIENLQSVSLKVPNGQYRVVLLTAEQLASRSTTPFGESFKVNGVEYFLGQSGVGDWYDTAYLRGAGNAVLDDVSYGAAGLTVLVEVGNGTVNLEFSGGPGGLGSILSGIVMEPVALPSRLDVSQVQGPARERGLQGGQGQQAGAALSTRSPLASLNIDSLVDLEFKTQAAIAAVSGISPAAGPGGGQTIVNAQPVNRPTTPAPPPPFVSPVGVSPSS